jgi:hypothetical protein
MPLQNAIARDTRWPRIVVYPEGNTCNGQQICGFKARPARSRVHFSTSHILVFAC